MSAFTDFAENKITDWLWRGQALTPPATWYIALFTANPSDTGGGTEVTGGSYARVAVAASLANFAGTQGAGSTVASTGNSATTSNNVVLTYPAPTAAWGTITGWAAFDASTGGNMWVYTPLTASKTVNSGDPAPLFAAAALTFQLDN